MVKVQKLHPTISNFAKFLFFLLKPTVPLQYFADAKHSALCRQAAFLMPNFPDNSGVSAKERI